MHYHQAAKRSISRAPLPAFGGTSAGVPRDMFWDTLSKSDTEWLRGTDGSTEALRIGTDGLTPAGGGVGKATNEGVAAATRVWQTQRQRERAPEL